MEEKKMYILGITETFNKKNESGFFEKEYLPKIKNSKDVLDIQIIEDGYIFHIKNAGGVTFYPEINALLYHFCNRRYRPGIEWLKKRLNL